MSDDLLFVYGTLRHGAPGSRHDLLHPATHVGAAQYQGRLYDLGAYPGVVASDDRSDTVRGDVYRLHDPTSLDRLDEYEGCGKPASAQAEYERVMASVQLAGGMEIGVWLYLYRLPCAASARIVSGDYLERR